VSNDSLTQPVGKFGFKHPVLVKGGVGLLLALLLSVGLVLASSQQALSQPQVIADGDDPKIGTGG
jgi:hypothetical protein